MPDAATIEHYIIVAGLAIGAYAALVKAIREWRSAPIDDDVKLAGLLGIYAKEIKELNERIDDLMDRIRTLEICLSENDITLPAYGRRVGDVSDTQPLLIAKMRNEKTNSATPRH